MLHEPPTRLHQNDQSLFRVGDLAVGKSTRLHLGPLVMWRSALAALMIGGLAGTTIRQAGSMREG